MKTICFIIHVDINIIIVIIVFVFGLWYYSNVDKDGPGVIDPTLREDDNQASTPPTPPGMEDDMDELEVISYVDVSAEEAKQLAKEEMRKKDYLAREQAIQKALKARETKESEKRTVEEAKQLEKEQMRRKAYLAKEQKIAEEQEARKEERREN